jgi:hypothetical protein
VYRTCPPASSEPSKICFPSLGGQPITSATAYRDLIIAVIAALTIRTHFSMSRYYILTDRHGVRLIEAAEVDESHPSKMHFAAGAKITSFDRRELLWWSPVEASLPGPYENFHPWPHGPRARGFDAESPFEEP